MDVAAAAVAAAAVAAATSRVGACLPAAPTPFRMGRRPAAQSLWWRLNTRAANGVGAVAKRLGSEPPAARRTERGLPVPAPPTLGREVPSEAAARGGGGGRRHRPPVWHTSIGCSVGVGRRRGRDVGVGRRRGRDVGVGPGARRAPPAWLRNHAAPSGTFRAVGVRDFRKNGKGHTHTTARYGFSLNFSRLEQEQDWSRM